MTVARQPALPFWGKFLQYVLFLLDKVVQFCALLKDTADTPQIWHIAIATCASYYKNRVFLKLATKLGEW